MGERGVRQETLAPRTKGERNDCARVPGATRWGSAAGRARKTHGNQNINYIALPSWAPFKKTHLHGYILPTRAQQIGRRHSFPPCPLVTCFARHPKGSDRCDSCHPWAGHPKASDSTGCNSCRALAGQSSQDWAGLEGSQLPFIGTLLCYREYQSSSPPKFPCGNKVTLVLPWLSVHSSLRERTNKILTGDRR